VPAADGLLKCVPKAILWDTAGDTATAGLKLSLVGRAGAGDASCLKLSADGRTERGETGRAGRGDLTRAYGPGEASLADDIVIVPEHAFINPRIVALPVLGAFTEFDADETMLGTMLGDIGVVNCADSASK